MDQSYDLIVVGGGVLGTFHAYHALQAGLKVGSSKKTEFHKARPCEILDK